MAFRLSRDGHIYHCLSWTLVALLVLPVIRRFTEKELENSKSQTSGLAQSAPDIDVRKQNAASGQHFLCHSVSIMSCGRIL